MLEIEKVKLLGPSNFLIMFRRIISLINLWGVFCQLPDWPQHDTSTTNIKLLCHLIQSCCLHCSEARVCDLSRNGRFTKTKHVHQVVCVCQARQNWQTKFHKVCLFCWKTSNNSQMNVLRLSKIFHTISATYLKASVQNILDRPMYVQTTKKSQLSNFVFLKLKLAHFDDINTFQEQLQNEVAPL
jgi:hypothetical protein